jgi:hypothetical protein
MNGEDNDGTAARLLGPGLKDPDGTVLAFGLRSWNDFAADVKAGRFDLI